MTDLSKEDWLAGYSEDYRPGGCMPYMLALVLALLALMEIGGA